MYHVCGEQASTEPISYAQTFSTSPKLDNKTEVKYLGLSTDQHLSQHIYEMYYKFRAKVGLLSRSHHYLPFQQTMMVYSALIQSIIDYGCSLWGHSSKFNVLTVQRMQNRFTNNFTHEISSSMILSQLSLMNINQRKDYFKGILAYKCLKNSTPFYLTDQLAYMHE